MGNTLNLAEEYMELLMSGGKYYNSSHEGYVLKIMWYKSPVVYGNGDFYMVIKFSLYNDELDVSSLLETVVSLDVNSSMSMEDVSKEITASINATIDDEVKKLNKIAETTNLFQTHLLK